MLETYNENTTKNIAVAVETELDFFSATLVRGN